MNKTPFSKAIPIISLFVCLVCVSPASIADPYYISYSGIISDSTLTGVNDTESYIAIIIFDNGSTSALSQTWESTDLTCAGFLLNDAQDAYFAHDLTLQGSLTVSGSITTDGAGALSTNFTELDAEPVDPGSYSFSGITANEPISWYMNDFNDVFYTNSGAFGDAAGGVQMAPANWSAPAPWTDTCGNGAPPAPVSASPIPFAPLWVLVLITGLLVFVGAKRLVKG
ncbi:MAG: hypothetical protein WBS20_16585 [Lysobacterales bacterium]